MWKRAAVAHASHLSAARFRIAILGGLPRNVREVAGMGWIGDVEQGGAVVFLLSGKRIRLRTTVMANVGDPALTLLVDGRLIGAARL